MDLQVIRNFTKSGLEGLLLDKTAEAKPLPFSLLAEITNDFSYKQEIGRGGFAVVCKGILDNGAVAVKRLSNSYMYEDQFVREVQCLVKVKHTNIVRFLGYCSEAQGNHGTYKGKFTIADIQERLLCFEYLPEGSLDYYIKDPSGGLAWNSRYDILKGICKGLHYLHSTNVLHLDLKPQNILMGENMIPKITDFGLSRVLDETQTRISATTMFGTDGYLAPESTSHEITSKFDLYSLGVIIMEILTGKKDRQIVDKVLESWGNRLDLSKGNRDRDQIRVCAEIGFECTDLDPTKRPVSMTHIMDRLAETQKEVLKDNTEQTARVVNHYKTRRQIETPLYGPSSSSSQTRRSGDKVVLYVTTLGGIRKTIYECNTIRAALQSHHVDFIEKDLFDRPDHLRELKQLLAGTTFRLPVPVLSINGTPVGDARKLLELHGEGRLPELFE